ncbi:unnamed protein product, partial [Rotaria magnacalcarata]
MTKYLRPLLSFKDKCSTFELFHDPSFLEAKQQFRTHMFTNFDSGLIWSFERAQTFPIRTSRKDLRKLVEFILKDQSKSNLEPIQYFSTLLEWIGLRWAFDEYLSPSVRQVLQRNVCITHDFIVECEVKFCCWELCKILSTMILQVIQEFPLESSTMNNDYLRLKKDFATKQNELDKCEENVQQLRNRVESLSRENLQTDNTNTIPATESHLINTRSRLQLNVSLFSAEDNDQQIRLEEATRELSQRRTEVNQLFDQLSRVEKSRTAVIDKALASRSKFSEEMQKLLASTAFQFVHD